MQEQWMPIAAAAARLDVHTRTIERRIASGKIQTRRADDGQLQVLVPVPETPPQAADALETVKELAQDQVSLAAGSASAIVRLAHVDAERARDELMFVRQEADGARQGARTAWIAVASLSAAIVVAVGWTSHRVTQSREQVNSLEQRAARVEAHAQQLLNERNLAIEDAQAARIASAEAKGRLAAYAEQAKFTWGARGEQPLQTSDKRPTTKPIGNMLQRVADAMAGD